VEREGEGSLLFPPNGEDDNELKTPAGGTENDDDDKAVER
jgi:hypothetical protein